jgi:hypothetical protein
MLRRAMIPVRWTHQGVPMAGANPQDIINEELLSNSDLLVAIFKDRLGGRGTEREVRYFMENGKGRRVMLFVHHDETNRDPALRDFLNEIRVTALYRSYIEQADLLEHLAVALLHRAELTRAARHVAELRAALVQRVREWTTLGHNVASLEPAFAVLTLIESDLSKFSGREVGLNVGVVDARVDELSGRIQVLTRDQRLFLEQAPWIDGGAVIAELADLLEHLPEECDLL